MDLTLKSLHLLNFKNHREARFDFNSRINCIAGANGSGKTNILEAIYYLSAALGGEFLSMWQHMEEQLHIFWVSPNTFNLFCFF